jgi:GNAT superfamily N-acetyltransferase
VQATTTSHEQWAGELQTQYPDARVVVTFARHCGTDGYLTVDTIVVSRDRRRQGIGSQVMTRIIERADTLGLPVAVSPSTDFGGTRAGLDRFYRRFGFRPNRGRGQDQSIRAAMIRPAT